MTSPQLALLLDLQGVDTAIGQAEYRLAHLPEDAAVAALDAQVADVQSQRASLVASRDEVAGRQGELEAELAATEDRIKAVNSRLYGGEVSASRDLQAMAADVEALGVRASGLEDQILEVLVEREPLDEQIGAIDATLAELAERRAAAAVLSDEARSGVVGALEQLQAKRAEVVAGVASDLLEDYDRIRARSGGVGAARLVGNRCDGCHLTLPAMELDRLRHAGEDTVVHCDECGRILIR